MKIVHWLLVIFLTAPCMGLDPAKQITQYNYRSWTQEEGMPQNSAYSLIQTRRGYLWIATQEGIACFDGHRFTQWNPQAIEGLTGQFINHLMEDSEGWVWSASTAGLTRMLNGGAVPNPLSDALKGVGVWYTYEDQHGVVWAGTDRGLHRLEDDQVLSQDMEDGLYSNTVNCMTGDGRGGLWIGTTRGLNRWTGGGLKKTSYPVLADRSILCLYTAPDGQLFIGTDQGLYFKKENQVLPIDTSGVLSNAAVNAVIQDRDGNLWVGTEISGLVRMSPDRKVSVFDRRSGLTHNKVKCFVEDREGNLWFGMDGGGLGVLGDVAVTTYTRNEGLPHNLVQGLTAGKNAIWIATFGGGLARLQGDSMEIISTEQGLPDTRLNAVLEDREGRLWIATEGGGVAQMVDNRFVVFNKDKGMPSNRARALFQDRLGALWVATDRGLARIYEGNVQIYSSEHGLKSRFVANMFEDSRGVFWVATRAGIRVLRDGAFTEPHIPELAETEVFGMYEDSEGRLWFSTSRAGLILVDGNLRHVFTMEDGLVADTVHEVIEDENNNLWLSSNKGISSIPIRDFLKRARGGKDLLNPRVFGLNEGMKSEECNGGTFPSLARMPNGLIWFPTMQGAVSISPGQIVRNTLKPPVHIEKFHANNQEVYEREDIVLEPETEKVEIRYTATSFTIPERVRFKVRLEGHDPQWTDGAPDRTAFYTNLRPGNYTFRVKAANSDGVWNEEGAQLQFHLKAHFYESTAFRLLVVLIAVLAAVSMHRLRLMQVERREKRLERVVASRTSDLEKANTRLLSAQGEVIAAAHRAGMIEIATNVLHLIGDSISKVSIISEQMDRRISTHHVYDDLKDEVDELLKNKDDMENYLNTERENRSLSSHLVDRVMAMPEHASIMRAHVREIRNHLNHMTKTVRAQQEYARVHGAVSSVDIPETIADALRLRNKLLVDLEVEVHQDYSRLPSFKGLKSKLLRVLVSLIQNACEAVAPMPDGGRSVTIRTQTRDGYILIEIEDTGVGIEPRLFKKIFAHGFSTKPGHQGFGLHSCANAVAEMGGRIMVDSDGPGQGAAFILELPISVVEDVD